MKEKDFTLTIDVHVTKEDTPNAKRHYLLKIYSHPISENNIPLTHEVSNMNANQQEKIGKNVLDAIWTLMNKQDEEYWG